jgi:hypothetical protein
MIGFARFLQIPGVNQRILNWYTEEVVEVPEEDGLGETLFDD